MKTFSKFLKEAGAIKSIPAIQGRRLGLVPDGHGGYHDKKTGEFIAKSTNGKLKFYNQNQVLSNTLSGFAYLYHPLLQTSKYSFLCFMLFYSFHSCIIVFFI